jgi:hypothetical protein
MSIERIGFQRNYESCKHSVHFLHLAPSAPLVTAQGGSDDQKAGAATQEAGTERTLRVLFLSTGMREVGRGTLSRMESLLIRDYGSEDQKAGT